jgi:hypothetical protein
MPLSACVLFDDKAKMWGSINSGNAGSFTRTFMGAGLLMCLLTPALSLANGWELRIDGLGPLRIGMKFDAVNKLLGNTLEHADNPLLAAESCDMVDVKDPSGVALMFINDKLTRIDVWDKNIATASGIRIGDRTQRVFDVYFKAAVEPHGARDPEEYLTAISRDGKLAIRFETKDDKVTRLLAGGVEAVQFVEGCL